MQLGKRRRTPHLYSEEPQAADAGANGPTVRVVHVCPPIVVYADPSDFRQVVQHLTGKVSVADTDTINERSKSLDYEASSASTTLESRSCKEVTISQISEHSVMCDSGQLICKAVSVGGQSMCYSGHRRLPLLDDVDQRCYAEEFWSYIMIDEISSDSEAALAAAFSSSEAEISSPSQFVSTGISGGRSPTNYSKNYITNTAGHGCSNPDNHGRLKQLKANISSPITTKEKEEIETPPNLNLGTLLSASETDQRQRIISTNWSDDASPALTASDPHQCFLHFDVFPFVDCLELEGFPDSQLDYLAAGCCASHDDHLTSLRHNYSE